MTKIAIIDDNLPLLQSLKQDLEATQQFKVAFTAANGIFIIFSTPTIT